MFVAGKFRASHPAREGVNGFMIVNGFMMLMMGQARRFSVTGSALVACLIAVALLAGPICASACPGAGCFAQSARSSKSTNCHGMAGHAGLRFSLRGVAKPCNLADGSVAVLSLSVRDKFAGASHGGKFGLAAARVNAQIAAEFFLVLSDSSAGPPPIFSSASIVSITLRI